MLNCFYCQSLNEIPTKLGLCEFCGKKGRSPEVPLYEIYYLGKIRFFCCQCVWWKLPHSQAEKVAENRYFNRYFSERQNQWYQAKLEEKKSELIKKGISCQYLDKYFNTEK